MAENSDRLPNLAKEFFLKYLNGILPSPIPASPSGIGNGQKIIQADNTPEPLSNDSTACYSIWIQTLNTNASSIYVGGPSVNSSSCKLSPNSNGFIDISNLSSFYVYGKAGDVINYVYTY